MKKGNTIKIVTIVLAVVLIAMIGFGGIFSQKQNRMENVLKDYKLAKDLKGARVVAIKPKENKETIIKDAEGNKVDEKLTDEQIAEKGYKKEEKDINEELKTKENFENAKKIIEKRLEQMQVQNYSLKLNDQTGEITVELEEDANTDTTVSNIGSTGKFEILDSETKDVLMSNKDIKESKVMYGSTNSGTEVYLDIEFTNENKSKFEEISKTYAKIKEEDKSKENEETKKDEESEESSKKDENKEETKQKQIIIQIDGQNITTTSFEKPVTNGKLQLTVGNASTDTKTINDYASRALGVATVLSNGNLPVDYEISGNEFILSDIGNKEIKSAVIVAAVIAILITLGFVIRYKLNGLLAGIIAVGSIALTLILVRYANVVLSLEGVLGLVVIAFINYVVINKLLIVAKKEEFAKNVQSEYGKILLNILPIMVMAIVFSFINWLPISSFGMVMFWGVVITAIYHWIVTVSILKLRESK